MVDDRTVAKSDIRGKVAELARSIENLAQSLDLRKEAGIDPADTDKLVATLMRLESMKALGLDQPDHETVEAIERMTAALEQAAAGRRKD